MHSRERRFEAERKRVAAALAAEGERAGSARRARGSFAVPVDPGESLVASLTLRPTEAVILAETTGGDDAPAAAAASPAPTEPAAPVAPLVVTFTGSGNVARAELDVATGIVTVAFKNGDRSYRYGNFTPALLEEWRSAPSAGRWFHVNVKTKPAQHPQLAVERVPE